MTSRLIFACSFLPLSIAIGELIHVQGKKIVMHAFGEASPIGPAIVTLLRIGYYLVTTGLLFWNIGTNDNSHPTDLQESSVNACLRLGIALSVIGILHSFNVLALSLFHKKNAQ